MMAANAYAQYPYYDYTSEYDYGYDDEYYDYRYHQHSYWFKRPPGSVESNFRSTPKIIGAKTRTITKTPTGTKASTRTSTCVHTCLQRLARPLEATGTS